MASQIFNPREPPKPAQPPTALQPGTGTALVLLSTEEAGGCSCPPPGRPVHRAPVTGAAAPPMRRSDEELVIDPRGRLTPAQLVEQKLLALLRTGSPGLYAQAAGKTYAGRAGGGRRPGPFSGHVTARLGEGERQ
jgi:hypothetical protein